VSLAQVFRRALPPREAPGYIAAQVGGAFLGVAVAHGMFGEAVFSASRHERSGSSQLLGETVATFGLVAVVWTTSRAASTFGPVAVASYITGAYWFTASTCFANPAVTLARAASDTFAGIRPADAPMFVVAQLVGASLAIGFLRWTFAPSRERRGESEPPFATTPGEKDP
jgi:glycerol uptake facilitator-like aquaporin